MQRWKAISAVLEKPPACACGEPVGPDWAFCARCGRGLGRGRAYFSLATIAGVAAGVAAVGFVAGVMLGGQRGNATPSLAAAATEAADLRTKLANADAASRRLKDRNDALWRQLNDRNDTLRKQLLDRQEALATHLNESTESARKQLKEQDSSIGLLANRAVAAEQLEEENAALRQSMQDTEEELRSLLQLQETANQTPAPAAGEPERPETSTQEGIEAFWAQFDQEHPTVNGRSIWEESMRAAIEDAGPDDANLRVEATRIFEERLAQAEETARGTPALDRDPSTDDGSVGGGTDPAPGRRRPRR